MRRKWIVAFGFLTVFYVFSAGTWASEAKQSGTPAGPSDLLIVSGTITNLQGKAVKEVGLHFYLNGQKVELEEEVTTSKAGRYEAELKVPKGALPGRQGGAGGFQALLPDLIANDPGQSGAGTGR